MISLQAHVPVNIGERVSVNSGTICIGIAFKKLPQTKVFANKIFEQELSEEFVRKKIVSKICHKISVTQEFVRKKFGKQSLSQQIKMTMPSNARQLEPPHKELDEHC